MNSPGPLPPVDPNAPEHLVTIGGFAWVFAMIAWNEVVTDTHDGNHESWLLAALLGLAFNIITGRMRQHLRRT